MEYRRAYTDIIGLMDPLARTHAASFFKGHWKTLCGRRLEPIDVAVIGTATDEITPSCKLCQQRLSP